MIASSYWFWSHPSSGAAEVWALLFLLVPSLAFRTEGKSFLSSLVNGADNRWSTSKVSVVLWTYAVVWAFLAVLLHTRGQGLGNVKLSSQYLLLLGIPGAAAVSAKAITQSKVATDADYKKAKVKAAAPPNALKGFGQLVSDDSGKSDLLDAQYFIFTRCCSRISSRSSSAASPQRCRSFRHTRRAHRRLGRHVRGKKGVKNTP